MTDGGGEDESAWVRGARAALERRRPWRQPDLPLLPDDAGAIAGSAAPASGARGEEAPRRDPADDRVRPRKRRRAKPGRRGRAAAPAGEACRLEAMLARAELARLRAENAELRARVAELDDMLRDLAELVDCARGPPAP